MHVLITGGAGFLGLHIAHYFHNKNWKITVYDIADFPSHEYPKGVMYIRGDVRDKDALSKAVKGVDVIIHAAAALPLRPEDDIRTTTVDGTRNVCDIALSSKIKQIVYISSTAVYGVPRKHPVYETDQRVGVGPYGESKIAAEDICREYRKKSLIITTIRPKTFLGTHRLGVFEILFDWIKDNKKIPVVGTGNNKYQLLEVDDLVEAIYMSVMHTDKEQVNTEFNVGAREFRTVKEDLHAMFKEVGSTSHIMPTPAAPIKVALYIFEQLHLSPLYKWVYATADKDSFVSVDKISKTIGWSPKHSNTQALVKAYKWYEKNYDEIKSRPAGTTHTVGWKQGVLGIFKKFL